MTTDAELTRIYNEANGIDGKNPPITTERIFRAMRAAYTLGLEEAARKCEESDQEYEPYTGKPKSLNHTCAKAIRAMKEEA